MELVAYLGKDKENWGQVTALINRFDCERVILIKDQNSDDFPVNEKCVIVEIDPTMPLLKLKNEIKEKLSKELSNEFEVAISIASGTGKEHMALISALLSIPVGIRLVVFTKNGIEIIN